jgi:hypothetical protein
VAESGLPLGCAHIGGKSTYTISCVFPTVACPTPPPSVAYALYLCYRRISVHIAALCARYSFRLTSTATTVSKSVPHGYGRDNPKYTSPAVFELAPRSCRRIPFRAQKHCLGFQDICQYNRRMVTFPTCKGAKSCPEFCGGVYIEQLIRIKARLHRAAHLHNQEVRVPVSVHFVLYFCLYEFMWVGSEDPCRSYRLKQNVCVMQIEVETVES